MRPVTTVEVIINAGAGIGASEEVCGRLRDAFEASTLRVKISLAQSGAEVIDLARHAARGKCEVVVAGGGDGTVNAVASAIIPTDKTLGVLPLGTLNHLAKDLKIPLEPEAAAQTIVAGHETNVDVGEVNGRIFLNNSSLGLYPDIVREREKQQRLGYRKWPAFAWAALTVLRRYPLVDVRLLAEGKELRRRTPFVFVGNNQYVMKGFNIGRRERLDEGQLCVYISPRTGRVGLALLALRALLGRIREEKDFLELRTYEVRIATRHKKLRVSFDGEVDSLKPPLHYRVRPGALRVIVPAPEINPASQPE